MYLNNTLGTFDVMIQQKYWTYGDLYSPSSLVLIADQLDHGQKRIFLKKFSAKIFDHILF